MEIDLRGKRPEMRGMTFDYAREITACAAICLAHHGHGSWIWLRVEGVTDAPCELRWTAATPQEAACYGSARDLEVIRRGAECLAIRLVHLMFGLEVIKKAPRGSGVDFWLGHRGQRYLGFNGMARLEVSGILEDNRGEYQRRMRQKLVQMAPTDGVAPGYAAVILFALPIARLEKRVEHEE